MSTLHFTSHEVKIMPIRLVTNQVNEVCREKLQKHSKPSFVSAVGAGDGMFSCSLTSEVVGVWHLVRTINPLPLLLVHSNVTIMTCSV